MKHPEKIVAPPLALPDNVLGASTFQMLQKEALEDNSSRKLKDNSNKNTFVPASDEEEAEAIPPEDVSEEDSRVEDDIDDEELNEYRKTPETNFGGGTTYDQLNITKNVISGKTNGADEKEIAKKTITALQGTILLKEYKIKADEEEAIRALCEIEDKIKGEEAKTDNQQTNSFDFEKNYVPDY